MTVLDFLRVDQAAFPEGAGSAHPLREAVSRAAARLALARAQAAFPGADITELSHKESGQPYFKDCSDVYVSISHSGAGVLVGVSDRPVGVDLEALAPLREPVLRRAYSAHERSYVESSPDRGVAFFEVWTRKEACAKAAGEGLSRALMIKVCDEYGPMPDITDSNNRKWRLKTYTQLEGFCASVCVEAGGGPAGLPPVIRINDPSPTTWVKEM